MSKSLRMATAVVALTISSTAWAQQPAPADPVALAAARDVVSKMQGDKNAVLQSMSAPLAGLVAQMGVSQPDRAAVLVSEVIVPTLAGHYDELLDVQARAFAAALSVFDLQAASTFYSSPAGRNFALAQPKLAQAQLAGVTQLMGRLAPELQTKLAETIKKRGWDKPARP